ncbi:ethylene-responsive transcription factor ERF018 [Humulus lupulus]|uniref:ethylene-responsive transcription factor ERF018 n=1 Tax=Humulus lupulus TaxID=3486 RepID=UPI002B400632|nr:ethylene-responsive transcription factor ERF018 [Humulus lupulus]
MDEQSHQVVIDHGDHDYHHNNSNQYPKYKGVRKRKWGKWVSEIRLPNSRERIWLGSYDMAEKAARAFDAAQFCLRGPDAHFNFPDTPPDIAGGQSLTPQEIQVVAARFANDFSIITATTNCHGNNLQEQPNPSYDDPPDQSGGEPSRRGSSSEDVRVRDDDDGFSNTDWSLFNFLDYSSNNDDTYYNSNIHGGHYHGSAGGYYDDFDPFSGIEDDDHPIIQYSGDSILQAATADDHDNNITTNTATHDQDYPFTTSHYYDSHSSFLWNF